MDRTTLTEDDKGKPVVNSQGDKVGMITEIEHGTAHVNPDPGITDTISSKLGWGRADEDETYELEENRVDTVTDDEIRLNE
jgi:hypothetical protein